MRKFVSIFKFDSLKPSHIIFNNNSCKSYEQNQTVRELLSLNANLTVSYKIYKKVSECIFYLIKYAFTLKLASYG